MNIKISRVIKLSIKKLKLLGFSQEEADFATENMLEGELTDKRSHGFVRLSVLKEKVEQGSININKKDITIDKETAISLLVNGQKKTGRP